MIRSKKKKNIRNLTLLALVLVAIIFAVLISYLSELARKRSPLPFEEVFASSIGLTRHIGLIDRAIYDGLYNMGVPQEKIVFVSVLPRHKDGHSWDFTSLEASIPRSSSVFHTGKEIRSRISKLQIPAEIRVDEKSGNEIIYNIYYKGLYTHSLKMILDIHAPPHRLSCPRIGFIVDDLGYDSAIANAFIKLDLLLTPSILPFAPNTSLIAEMARKEGLETMLHLPMEPISFPGINSGEGVLLKSMDKQTILEVLNRDLSQIPFIAGVNNHMGSGFTESEEKMIIVLAELKKRGLYFVDSRTSSNSVAFKIARRMALQTARRDIFLDNDISENALKTQMERLIGLARYKGRAIGIGHPHKETLKLLERCRLILKDKAEIVPVSDLVRY